MMLTDGVEWLFLPINYRESLNDALMTPFAGASASPLTPEVECMSDEVDCR